MQIKPLSLAADVFHGGVARTSITPRVGDHYALHQNWAPLHTEITPAGYADYWRRQDRTARLEWAQSLDASRDAELLSVVFIDGEGFEVTKPDDLAIVLDSSRALPVSWTVDGNSNPIPLTPDRQADGERRRHALRLPSISPDSGRRAPFPPPPGRLRPHDATTPPAQGRVLPADTGIPDGVALTQITPDGAAGTLVEHGWSTTGAQPTQLGYSETYGRGSEEIALDWVEDTGGGNAQLLGLVRMGKHGYTVATSEDFAGVLRHDRTALATWTYDTEGRLRQLEPDRHETAAQRLSDPYFTRHQGDGERVTSAFHVGEALRGDGWEVSRRYPTEVGFGEVHTRDGHVVEVPHRWGKERVGPLRWAEVVSPLVVDGQPYAISSLADVRAVLGHAPHLAEPSREIGERATSPQEQTGPEAAVEPSPQIEATTSTSAPTPMTLHQAGDAVAATDWLLTDVTGSVGSHTDVYVRAPIRLQIPYRWDAEAQCDRIDGPVWVNHVSHDVTSVDQLWPLVLYKGTASTIEPSGLDPQAHGSELRPESEVDPTDVPGQNGTVDAGRTEHESGNGLDPGSGGDSPDPFALDGIDGLGVDPSTGPLNPPEFWMDSSGLDGGQIDPPDEPGPEL